MSIQPVGNTSRRGRVVRVLGAILAGGLLAASLSACKPTTVPTPQGTLVHIEYCGTYAYAVEYTAVDGSYTIVKFAVSGLKENETGKLLTWPFQSAEVPWYANPIQLGAPQTFGSFYAPGHTLYFTGTSFTFEVTRPGLQLPVVICALPSLPVAA